MSVACNKWEGGRDFCWLNPGINPKQRILVNVQPNGLQGSQERKAGQTNTGKETKTCMLK